MNQRDIGALLKLITDKLRAGVDAKLKDMDLTFSQSTVLNFLYDCKTETTQKEIELFLGVSHPAVAGLVSRLEKNEFVYSYPDPNDKRNKMVGLTDKAKYITSEIQKQIFLSEKALTYNLSESETESLRSMLITVYENFDKYAE